MAKITKTLSKRVDKQTNRAEILFRFIANSTIILRAKSGIFIDPKLWSEKSGELKSTTFGVAEVQIKTKLNNLCDTILEAFINTDIKQINKDWLTAVIYKFHNPESPEAPSCKLFNLKDDPYENNDVAKENEGIRRMMNKRMIVKLEQEGALYPICADGRQVKPIIL